MLKTCYYLISQPPKPVVTLTEETGGLERHHTNMCKDKAHLSLKILVLTCVAVRFPASFLVIQDPW